MAPGQRLDQITHMSTNTTEAALEACIERHLTGGVSVMPPPGTPLTDDVGVYQTAKGAG